MATLFTTGFKNDFLLKQCKSKNSKAEEKKV